MPAKSTVRRNKIVAAMTKAFPSSDETWVTAKGERLAVADMAEEHARNALRTLIRKIRTGQLIDTPKRVYVYAKLLAHESDRAQPSQFDVMRALQAAVALNALLEPNSDTDPDPLYDYSHEDPWGDS